MEFKEGKKDAQLLFTVIVFPTDTLTGNPVFTKKTEKKKKRTIMKESNV